MSILHKLRGTATLLSSTSRLRGEITMDMLAIVTAAGTSVLAVASVIGLLIRPFKTVNDKLEKVNDRIETVRKEASDAQKEIGQRIERSADRLEQKIDQQGQQLTELIGAVGEIKGAVPQITDRISNLERWNNGSVGAFREIER